MTELSKQDFEAVRTKPPAPRNMQPPKPPPRPETEAEANRRLYAENQKLRELLRDGGFYKLNDQYLLVEVKPYDVLAMKWASPTEKRED